jgi:hypothetical protein
MHGNGWDVRPLVWIDCGDGAERRTVGNRRRYHERAEVEKQFG